MMRFLSIKERARRRGISVSGEKRLRAMYPEQYGTEVELTPGRKGVPEGEDDAFSQWLIDRQKAKNAALAAEAEDKEAEDAEAKDTAEGEYPDAEDAEEAEI